MTWTDIFNLVLAAVSVACLLWGVRQRVVIRRLRTGLDALRAGKLEWRARRGPDDFEPVLLAFDQLADELVRRSRELPSTISNHNATVQRLSGSLRLPLATVEGFAALIAGRLAEGRDEPANASIAEWLTRLRFQVLGLLRLLETPTEASRLRQELSRLRQSAAPSPALDDAPAVLLVDDDNPLSQRLAASVRHSGWRAFQTPLAESAALVSAVVEPQVAILNGGPESRGWSALATLKQRADQARSAICLYGRASQDGGGRLWAPIDVWLWPIDLDANSVVQSWRERPGGAAFAVQGESRLAAEVIDLLAGRGMRLENGVANNSLVLDGCCTVSVRSESAAGQPDPFVLIVPRQHAADHPADLAQSFADAVNRQPIGYNEIVDRACRRLGHVAATAAHASPQPAVAT